MPILNPGEDGPPREGRYWDPEIDPNVYYQNPIQSQGVLEENPRTRGRHIGRPRPRPQTVATDMVIVPHWDDVDEGDIWDHVTLGPFTFAGTAKIEGEGPRLRVDKRCKKGATFTRLVSNGYDTTELQIILRLWTPQHLEDYEALVDEIQPKRTGKPYALEVYHPALALARIKYVLVYGVGFLKPTGTPGLFESHLRCFEYIEGSEEGNNTRNATQTVPLVTAPPVPLDQFYDTANDSPRSAPTPSSTGANP